MAASQFIRKINPRSPLPANGPPPCVVLARKTLCGANTRVCRVRTPTNASFLAGMPRTLILLLWAALICLVITGTLLPAASPVMVAISRLHINHKVQHLSAPTWHCPACLCSDSRTGGGEFRQAWQCSFSAFSWKPASIFRRAGMWRFGDVIANGAGVGCGALLGLPVRALLAVLPINS